MWSPNSKEFGVVYGYMPAKTTIFNFRGVAMHSFPLAPRNTILFSPHGRFVAVAGFGNLAGQMDIYDLEKDAKKVSTIEASNTTVCEWSPDGKHILTATTSPRLRVDNGVRIWHVTGTLMFNQDLNELYYVWWRPAEYSLGDPFKSVPTPHASAQSYLAKTKAPSKPVGAYRPPGARGQSTPLAFKREDEGGAAFNRDGPSSNTATNGFGKPRKREVPGAEQVNYVPPGAAPGGGVALPPGAEAGEKLSKSAAKNKKKREAKKAKEQAEKSGGGNQTTNKQEQQQHLNAPNDGRRRQRSRSRNRSPGDRKDVNGAQDSAAAEKQTQTGTGAATSTPQDKRIRALLKKLRAIDELKMRLAGGEKLEDTQIKKIQTEDAVRKELESLGYTD